MTRRRKLGCLIAASVGVVSLVVLGLAAGLALYQNRNAAFESRTAAPALPPAGARPLKLVLVAHTATVSVKPVAAGQPVRIEADYDPRRHEFVQETARAGDTDVLTVELRPRGSALMALLRVKLGGRPAALRIAWPRDLAFDVEGHLDRGYAAMEFGGTSLRSARLRVEDGGAKVSFGEPTAAPMERLSLSGSRSSLGLVGLGNANPRETRVFQHIGAVDLDLRGAWRRDASVRVRSGAAGGSVWLPDNVRIRGVPDDRANDLATDPEIALPTIELELEEHLGRFVVID